MAAETHTVTHRKKLRDGCVNDTGLRFDAKVPVRVIDVPPPAGAQGAIIATHSTYRLAQRWASYEILEYRCPVLQQTATGELHTTPIPAAIFSGSVADVSFLAGLLVDNLPTSCRCTASTSTSTSTSAWHRPASRSAAGRWRTW